MHTYDIIKTAVSNHGAYNSSLQESNTRFFKKSIKNFQDNCSYKEAKSMKKSLNLPIRAITNGSDYISNISPINNFMAMNFPDANFSIY